MDNLSKYLNEHEKYSDTVLIFTYKDRLINPHNYKIIGSKKFSFLREDYRLIEEFIELNNLENFEIFKLSSNQAVDLLDLQQNYRVEPGAVIREKVILEKDAIVLMNATINIGARIGEKSMIDMGAIIGSRAQIGKNCHIGANAVIAGVLEPESSKPVTIEDDVFVGANSVVLEGVTIGHDSIIGAMTLVNKDIPPYSLAIGVPCRIEKRVDEKLKEKCKNNPLLRK